MKRKIFFLLLSSCFLVSSNIKSDETMEDWYDHWVRAIQCKFERNYEESIEEFTKAIFYVEKDPEEKYFRIYIDRASVYRIQKKWYDALVDLNVALDSKKLTKDERIYGLEMRIEVWENIGMHFKACEDMIELNSYL